MKKKSGFTLIELLVVLAIISLLITIVLIGVGGATRKAKLNKTKSDLVQLRKAIMLLEQDTGKWPNGCPINQLADPEIKLDNPQAGLTTQPTVGVVMSPCEWTSQEVAEWKGPYLGSSGVRDPWGNSYWFDPDYMGISGCCGGPPAVPYPGCPGLFNGQAIVSFSIDPDQTWYSCNNIAMDLISNTIYSPNFDN